METKKPAVKEVKKQVKKEAKKEIKATEKKVVKKPEPEPEEEPEAVELIATKPSKVVKKPVVVPAKKSKEDESDISLPESDSEEEVKPAPAKEVKKVPAKKEVAKPAVKAVKKEEPKKEAKKETKKETKKQAKEESESSVDMSDIEDEEEEQKPVVKTAKKNAKQEEAVEAQEENEGEEAVQEEPEEQEEVNEEQEERVEEQEPQEEIKAETQEEQAVEEGEVELFIGNMPFSATESQVIDFFSYYGPVESVKLLQRDDRFSGKGFLRFKDAKAAAEAHKNNGIDFNGRALEIRYSSESPPPRTFGAPQRSTSNENTIFIGGLSYNSTQDTISEFFKDCGNITQVRIAMDPSGQPKGFAHVEFDSGDAVSNALTLSGQRLDGRAIRIDVAGNKSSKPGDRPPPRQFGGPQRRGPPRGAPVSGVAVKNKGIILPSAGKHMKL